MQLRKLETKIDHRGWLAEILRREELEVTEFGQFFVFTSHSGAVRGNHYHTRKQEWFCLLKGKAEIRLKDLNTGEKKTVILEEQNLSTIKINPYTVHAVINIGDTEMLMLSYVDEAYNAKDPDTYSCLVEE